MSFRRWILPKLDKDGASQLAEECELHPFLALLLLSRGIDTPEDVRAFLWDEDEECDPFLFADMDAAVDRVQQAIDNGESILVFGDYDADGVTAAVLLYSYLREQNARVDYYIPHRDEGYGLNIPRLEALAQQGVRLIVTVDNGIAAEKEVAYARSLGIDVVVTDHHQPQEVLPEAVAVVDPHRRDCETAFKDYAGVGVAYKLVCALDGDPAGVMERYGDLVALGTLADVMPLKGENRRLVRLGLRRLNEDPRTGLAALLEVAGAGGKTLTSSAAVYTVAPRINAAGRMGAPEKAAQLLLSEDAAKAAQLAGEIQAMNQERQQVESDIMEEVLAEIARHPEWMSQRVLVLQGKGWHHGVVGIIAARVLERFGKPCVVLSITDGHAKGSGRSLPGFSLFDAIAACEPLLLNFGGHELAAGVGLAEENIPAFRECINAYAAAHFPDMPVKELHLDCKLRPSQIDLEKLQLLAAMEPFGAGNPTPLFGLFDMQLDNIMPVSSGKHLRLSVSRDNCRLSVMYFQCTVEELIIPCGSKVHLAVTLDRNDYRGVVSPSIIVRDIRYADTDQEAVIRGMRDFERICRREPLSEKLSAPSRDQLAVVYRFLKYATVYKGTLDQLYHALGDGIDSYAGLLVALQVLTEAGLLRMENNGDRLRIDLMPTERKADLAATPIMRYLCNGEE